MGRRCKHFSAWDTAFYLHTHADTLKWIKRRRGKPARSRIVRFTEQRPFVAWPLAVLAMLVVIGLVFILDEKIWGPDGPLGKPGLFMFMLAIGYVVSLARALYVHQTKVLPESQTVIAHQRTAQVRRMLRTGRVEPVELLIMVERRRTWWRQWLPSNPGAGRERFMVMSRVIVYALCAALVGLVLYFIEPSVGDDVPYPAVLGLFVVYALYSWGSIRWFNRRLCKRMLKQQCPDCGYDATALPPAFTHEELAWIGPVRCSECGSPWPLIPPPPADTLKQPPEPDLPSRWETRCRALGHRTREKWGQLREKWGLSKRK